MKKLFILCFIVTAFWGISAQQVQHIDTLKASYTHILDSMYSQYDKLQSSLMRESPAKTAPDSTLESAVLELQALQKRIMDFEAVADSAIQKIRQDELKVVKGK